MIFIVTALHCEAKPFIKKYGLKRVSGIKPDIYRGAEMCLIVSGTGIIRSAAATACLLALNNSIEGHAYNVGICGCAVKGIRLGTPVLMNKIVNENTGRSFYPDMLFESEFMEGTLHSYSAPVYTCRTERGYEFADMEAAGFMEAALMFLPPHRIHCMKLVSDYMDGEKLEPDYVTGLLEECIPRFGKLVLQAAGIAEGRTCLLNGKDIELLGMLSENLKLSVAMRYDLDDMAKRFKATTGNELHTVLSTFENIRVHSKKEGKIPFAEIRRILTGE